MSLLEISQCGGNCAVSSICPTPRQEEVTAKLRVQYLARLSHCLFNEHPTFGDLPNADSRIGLQPVRACQLSLVVPRDCARTLLG
jgi:hypothetical protein